MVQVEGAGQGQGSGPRPWAAFFAVPEDPEAATGSPVFEYGSQVANFENHSVVDFVERFTK